MTRPAIDIELRQRFIVDGVELAWDRWGPDTGTELVLCHGYSGSAHDFALHLGALAADRPVLALDHRGHGRSTKVEREDAYSVARLAKDFTTFLAASASAPVDLLGHSMGGRIALITALDHPELVRSIVLMDTSAWSFRSEDRDARSLLDAFFVGYDPVTGLPDTSGLAGPEAELILSATPTEWLRRRAELSIGFDPYALKALGLELFLNRAPSMRDRLSELSMPVTVISGSNDHPFVGQAAELAEETRADELVLVDGAYHSPQLTHQTEWAAAVARHLMRTDARG